MRIGPYEVLAELGRGGMGVVYRVRAPDGREAALKLLLKADDEAQARFERERRLLASLGEEQGFVGLLDAGRASSGPWIAMPLVPGGTLRRRLDAGPLGVHETVALGIELAGALGAAHERGVVHRDVKPENVLFTASGRALLADLGLAKHFDPAARGASLSVSLTREGAFKGTAAYMAPEQILDPSRVGPAADVFALAAVLHECLSGRPTFGGHTVVEVLARVSSGSHEAIGRADVPRWLEATLGRALSVDPAKRFTDGGSFARALGQSTGAAPGRRRGPVVALALGSALGAVVLGGAWLAFGRSEPRAPTTMPRRAPAPPPPPSRPPPQSPDLARKRREAEDLDRRGQEKADRDDWDGALDDVTRAIEVDPGLAPPWAHRAMARMNKGDLDGAIADATRAIELDPGIALAWGVRGAARDTKGDFDGTITDETRAIELDPENALCWYNRGSARSNKHEAEAAIADLTRAIQLDPRFSLALASRAGARNLKGDWDGAIADATTALELEQGLTLAWTVRGHARLQRGDSAGAIADASRAIELDPRSAAAWGNRGFAKAASGELAGAIADFERNLQLEPNGPDSVSVRGGLANARKHLR